MDRRTFFKISGMTVVGGLVSSSVFQACTPDQGDITLIPTEPEKPTGHFSLMQLSYTGEKLMMGYILKTQTGKVIVIDGGTAETADCLRAKLAEYGNHVTAWWITHPHSDHIGAIRNILKDKEGITIDTIYHSRFSEAHCNREPDNASMVKNFYTQLDNLTDTNVVSLHTTGGRYDLDGVHIKVLGVTNEEIATNTYNNSSIILRFEDDTKTVVFLGDAGVECGDKVLQKHHMDLHCDYLQMAHHGQKGVSELFYKSISFKTCLWPTPKWLWDADGYKTGETRAWMKDKGLKEGAAGTDDHRMMWRDIDWMLE